MVVLYIKYNYVNIIDTLTLSYEVVQPSQSDLHGFKEDATMQSKVALDGSDLGINSNWTISKIKNDKYHFQPLNARSVWSHYTGSLTYVKTNFVANK